MTTQMHTELQEAIQLLKEHCNEEKCEKDCKIKEALKCKGDGLAFPWMWKPERVKL